MAYTSTHTGAQIDSGVSAGIAAGAVSGLLKGNGSGGFSAAVEGVDYIKTAAMPRTEPIDTVNAEWGHSYDYGILGRRVTVNLPVTLPDDKAAEIIIGGAIYDGDTSYRVTLTANGDYTLTDGENGGYATSIVYSFDASGGGLAFEINVAVVTSKEPEEHYAVVGVVKKEWPVV